MSEKRHIKILDKITAMKIAAGEVIERPASAVRELLDNSIDAGSSEISVDLAGGGMKEIRVIDNGEGMDKEDLRICSLPHSTSKIETAEDLFKITTMGFRGEALSSIAASGKLEIISSNTGGAGYRVDIDRGSVISYGPAEANKGTVVSVKDLFCYMPARKKFLKSPSAETSSCRNIFMEKAAAFPDISFRLFIDGKLSLFLPPASEIKRIADIYPFISPEKFYQRITAEEKDYKIKIFFPGVEVIRKDRKYIKIYINRRVIQEYALVQAVCFGLGDYFPGGTFPAAFLFIEIDPALVDFNIHPAKKEVKIKNLPQIHHSITEALRNHMKSIQPQAGKRYAIYPQPEEKNLNLCENRCSYLSSADPRPAERNISSPFLRSSPLKKSIFENDETCGFRYLGQIFSSFLLCEKGNSLFIIDQHAAQERFYFDKFSNSRPDVQPLLVPVYIKTEDEKKELIKKNIDRYSDMGIVIKEDDTGELFIDAMPALFFEMKNDVLDLLKEQKGDTEDIKRELYARAACKKSVKAGDDIDHENAAELLKKIFEMPMPRCPHGRPLYYEITKKELYSLLGRT